MRIIMLMVLWLVAGSVQAGSVAGTGGSLETTQYLNYSELYSQTNTVISQLETQMSQLENMRKQVMSLGVVRDFTKAKKMFDDISGTVKQVQSIGYDAQKLAGQFSSLYPDFNAKSGTNYFDQYKDWSKDVKSTLKGAMSVANIQATNFANDAATSETIQKMVSEANSSESQLAAISAGNNVALAMHGEMLQMRQMQVVQNAAQTSYLLKADAEVDVKTEKDQKIKIDLEKNPSCYPNCTPGYYLKRNNPVCNDTPRACFEKNINSTGR